MKKNICLIIVLIMCTTFLGVISSADNTQQNVQSNLQQSVYKHDKDKPIPNWFVITNYTTAKNVFKDNPEMLNKCSSEFFLEHNIYVISFSVNASATVTYAEPFKYNVSYPEYLCKCLKTYTDYLIVDKDMDFNGVILLNETYAGDGRSEINYLYPKQIIFTLDQAPKVKKVTQVKAKSPKKKTVQVSWKNINDVSGYIVKLSANKKFKSGKTKRYTVNKNKISIKKLNRNKKYYIKIKAYKNVILNGKRVNVYSKNWSKVKAVKTK